MADSGYRSLIIGELRAQRSEMERVEEAAPPR
jgi:hypothetical protein